MSLYNVEIDVEGDNVIWNSIGFCPSPEGKQDHIWFSRWFLDLCYVDAPSCIWQRDGNKITQTFKDDYKRPSGQPNPPNRIWILTEHRNTFGERLGRWPD